jgi:hypothetical protein
MIEAPKEAATRKHKRRRTHADLVKVKSSAKLVHLWKRQPKARLRMKSVEGIVKRHSTPYQNQLEQGSACFLHDVQYLTIVALLSHPQKGASSRSERSGVGSRPRRGVGGGVGSSHPLKALSSPGNCFELILGLATTTTFGLCECLAKVTCGAKPGLSRGDAGGEGKFTKPTAEWRSCVGVAWESDVAGRRADAELGAWAARTILERRPSTIQ